MTRASKSIEELLLPENQLEKNLLKHPYVIEGLKWGKPRKGHPEGQVLLHVREVLDNVDKLEISPKVRSQLRLISIIHDTFKYKSNNKSHSLLAAEFLEHYTDDQQVLKVVALHDEAYYSWREINQYGQISKGQKRLKRLLQELDTPTLNLYFLFFKCDTQTGNKTQEPIQWFEQKISK